MSNSPANRGEGVSSSDGSRAQQVELILEQIEHLPTLSPVATRLLAITSNQDAALSEIASLIETDPALTGRVLGMCRRADKGVSEPIKSVRRAVTLLGLDAVRAAVLSLSVYDALSPSGVAQQADNIFAAGSDDLDTFDRTGFWRHSVATACAAELIAKRTPDLNVAPDEAFVAGVLHDVGKLALDLILPRAYARVLGLARRRCTDAAEIEHEVLGLDHHTAGKRLLERWGLPQSLRDAVWLHGARHTERAAAQNQYLVAVVGLARTLCRSLHLGWAGDYGITPDVTEMADELGVSREVLNELVKPLQDVTAARCTAMGLEETTGPELLLASIGRANRELARMNTNLREKAAVASKHAATIKALQSFLGRVRADANVASTLGEVSRSAAHVLGKGFFAAVYQPDHEIAWRVVRFGPQFQVVDVQLFTPPLDASRDPGGRGLAGIASSETMGASVAALSTLPWIAELLSESVDVRSLRAVGISASPAAVLLHDRERSLPGGDTLRAAWASALAAAAAREELSRVQERLTESSRHVATMQSKLSDAKAMSKLGEIAAGAAHEMNNPLTTISGRAQLLSMRLVDERDRQAAEQISKAAMRLGELIASLHVLSTPPLVRRVGFDPSEACRNAIANTQKKLARTFDVDIAANFAPSSIWLDRELVVNALTELLTNAVEATPSSQSPEIRIAIETTSADGRLEISVTDHGTGMSPATLQHCFDPFFSDKAAGRQTGLGLSRAKAMIQAMGGQIDLRSAPGTGTTARMSVPDWQEPVQRAA